MHTVAIAFYRVCISYETKEILQWRKQRNITLTELN